MATVQVVAHNPEVVVGNVSKEWASSAIAHSPNIWCSGFEALVDLYKSIAIQLDPGLLESDTRGVRCPAGGDQQIC